MDYRMVEQITKSPLRKSLFHFTRVRNLQAVAHFNSLYSSFSVSPSFSDRFREMSREVDLEGWRIVLNPHLRITDTVMDPDTSISQFRIGLDRHVFFWPTKRDCQKMMETYKRREPDERFVVIRLHAAPLIRDHFDKVKLTKYDSGSSPKYPNRCSYKKSLSMFLPIAQFGKITDNLVPSKPSEIREVLVEGEVTRLSNYLQAIYCENMEDVPQQWQYAAKPLTEFEMR
jgi:hypothetical protein